MTNAISARHDLPVWRNDDYYEYPIRVVGVDLTGIVLKMDVRLEDDTPGPPLIALRNVDTAVQGLWLVGVSVVDGVEVSDLRIRMDRATLQALDYTGDFGEAAQFDYALLFGGRTRLFGKLILPPHAFGSDDAPEDRAPSYGTSRYTGVQDAGSTLTISKDGGVTVAIDGADLVSRAIVRSENARDEAVAAAKDTVAALDNLGQDVLAYVGRPADAVLVTGTPKGVGSVFWHDAVDVAGNLTSVDVFDRAAGVVNVAVYRGPLNALVRVAVGSFTTTGTGTSRRIALAAPLPARPGDILAIQPADGALTVAEVQSGDVGYTYGAPFLPENVSLDAPTTNGQVQVRFVITYREQIVTADNFLALSEIRVVGARARALSSAANPAGYVAWSTTGAPTGHTVTWGSYTAKLGPLADRMEFPQWSVSKPLFVVGNSLSDPTDVLNRWSQLLAARYGQHLVSVARYSSDQRMAYRTGAAPISLTLAGALPAGGSVAVTQINGAPIDGNNRAAFLTTGDPAVVTGMSMTGYVSRNGVEHKVTVSAPNGASFAYSVTQAPGQTAITFDGPVLFTPDASLSIHGSTCIVWLGNNFFFSEVPNQYGDYTNPQMWVDLKLIVSFLQSQGCQVLLLPIIPASLPEWVEGVGTPLTASRAANARTEQLFPGLMARHADGRDLIKFLQDHKDGSADAQADISKGWIPRNLHRAGDALHLNADGDIAVADFVDSALRSQVGPPAITQATTFTVTAQGTQAGPDATASVRVVRDQLASLADAVDGVVQDAVYRPTIAAAIADFEVGTFFVSRDLDGLTAHTGVKWQYKVTAAAPHFSDEGPWSDTNAAALGLDAYVGTTPARLPVSVEQAGAIASARADALDSTSALGLLTNYALDRRVRTDAPQTLSATESANARGSIQAPYIGDFNLLKSGFPRLEDWNAYGDGRDDTAAVQAALNSNEGVIYVPAKTFICDALTLNSRKDLRSMGGRTGTAGGFPIFKLADNASGDQLTIGVTGVLTVASMSFAGNRQGQTQPRSGIVATPRTDGVYSQALIADRFIMRDFSGWVAKIGTNRNAAKLLRCLLQGGALGGVLFDGSQDLSAIDTEISFNEGPNVVFDTTTAASASHFMHLCRLYYAGHSYATGAIVAAGVPSLVVKGANNRSLSFFDGQINSNTGEAIRIEATETISDQNFVFEGMEFNGNSKGSAGTYSNIYTASRNLRVDGHYAGYGGNFPVKHILEVAPALGRVPIDCTIGADASAYAVSYSNGAALRGQINQVQGEYSNNSQTQIEMTIDIGKRHFDLILNVSSGNLTSSIGTEREGYHALVNIHAIATGKTLTVKKSTGTTSLTIYQPGLYLIVYRNGAWIATKLGLSSIAAPDGAASGNEFYSSTNGGTVTAPVTAKLINLQVGASATAEKLSMPTELEVQGTVVDLIVRNLGSGGILHVLKSSGTETTSVGALGTYRLIFTQGVWKVVRVGDVPA